MLVGSLKQPGTSTNGTGAAACLRTSAYYALLVMMATLIGCGSSPKAPIESRAEQADRQIVVTPVQTGSQRSQIATEKLPASGYYSVTRGDSLHSIAWRYGLDYRDIARWNNLSNPNLIYVGQRLALVAPRASRGSSTATAPAAPATRKQPPVATPAPATARSTAPAPTGATTIRGVSWVWPADGKVERTDGAAGLKGVRILGERGQPVRAAANGEVVYSGSGLRGYGKLIIVKHNAEYLSAYAHNDTVLVQEGAIVTAGQKIAEMGDSGANRVLLYFEIRKDGVAIEPLQFLPRR